MAAEDLRIAERGRGREMILERDFPLHVPSGTTTIGVPDYARTRPRLPASRAPWRFPEMKMTPPGFAIAADAIRIST
jgi:hypothetical protein